MLALSERAAGCYLCRLHCSKTSGKRDEWASWDCISPGEGCHFAILPFYIFRKVPNMLKEASVESDLGKLSTLSLLAAYSLL